MRVLVCVKRVPMTGGTIVLTDDAQAIETRHLGFTISPHEECGVEEAVRLVEANGGESVVLTLGPDEAEEQLRDAMAIGIDRAIHLAAGDEEWDPQATAAAVLEAIREDEEANGAFDLVFFGNESADTGGYQVGIRVAHALGRPIATGLKALTVDGGAVRCEQDASGARDVYVLALPAVVSVKEGLNLPRYPSVPGRLRAQRKPLEARNAGASRAAAREAPARRARGRGQAGRDPRRGRGGGPAGRRGAPADRGRVTRPRLRRARGRATSTSRRCRRSPSPAPSAAARCRPSALVSIRHRRLAAALAGHGVATLHVAEGEVFALVRAAGDRGGDRRARAAAVGDGRRRPRDGARQRGHGPCRRAARPASGGQLRSPPRRRTAAPR